MATTSLLTDHYELTMLQAALASGTAHRRCTFEVFTRRLPASRRYDHVPDPWYTGNFNETRAILTACCDALLTRLQNGAM